MDIGIYLIFIIVVIWLVYIINERNKVVLKYKAESDYYHKVYKEAYKQSAVLANRCDDLTDYNKAVNLKLETANTELEELKETMEWIEFLERPPKADSLDVIKKKAHTKGLKETVHILSSVDSRRMPSEIFTLYKNRFTNLLSDVYYQLYLYTFTEDGKDAFKNLNEESE